MNFLRCLTGLFLLSGCFDAHAAPGTDAGFAPDDAGHDAGGPIARCEPTVVGEPRGEPCFCNGPVALAGDVLYRRGLGIEVFDLAADPRDPTFVRTLEERSSSSGVLIVDEAERTLYSVTDIEPGVYVYDLADPRSPTRIARLEVTGVVIDGALDEGTLVLVGSEGEEGRLYVVDVSTRAAPRIATSITLEGRPSHVALDGDVAVAVLATGIGSTGLTFVDLRTEAVETMPLEGGDFGRAVAIAGDRVFVSGGPRALTVLGRASGAWSMIGEVGDETTFSRGLLLDGTRVLLGGDALRVIDVSDPSGPRLVGVSSGPAGDIGALALRDELAYVSSGNGVGVVALRCE